MARANVNVENEAAVEMTEDEKKATVRKYENDILGGLMAAAAYKTDAEGNILRKLYRSKLRETAPLCCLSVSALWEKMNI